MVGISRFQEWLAARDRERELREAAKAGRVVDPDVRGRGVAKSEKPGGRKPGKKRGYEKTHKPLAAPTLRRDPTACERLHIISQWQERAKEEGVKQIKDLPSRVKRELEVRFHWQFQTVQKWVEHKIAYQEIVTRLRLGVGGLRPFGSRRSLRDHSKMVGARLRVWVPGVPCKSKPLERVMFKLKKWFDEERAFRHEMRQKVILTRLKYELEYERDRQLVLRDHGDEQFEPFVLEPVQKRLQTFQIVRPSKKQEDWFMKVVAPRIRATARKGQTLHENVNRKQYDEKIMTSWATVDRFVYLITSGTPEEL